MTQLLERSTDSIVSDMDELILSLPNSDAISDAFLLSEGGIAPVKDAFLKARIARLEATPIIDELLPELDFFIGKAEESEGKAEAAEQKPVRYVESGARGKGSLKESAGGVWMTAEGSFAPWSSVGRVQSAKAGFLSGFKRQWALESEANKTPKSKLHKEDPKTYWKERGKLASEFAQAMDGINKGRIKGKDADRLLGVSRRGKNVSGLSGSDQSRRKELLAQGNNIDADGSKELKKLNSGLSLRERAADIGTSLEMVEYHVNQIKDSGSKLQRALNPALSRVAPPIGIWPSSMGGAAVAKAAGDNWQKNVGRNLPKAQKGSLERQYQAAARGEAQGRQDQAGRQGGAGSTPPAHTYGDREYKGGKSGWTAAPEGVTVYTSPRGKQYYLRSEKSAFDEQKSQEREAKEKAKKAKVAQKKKKKEKKEKEPALVPAGGIPEEDSPDSPDTGAGTGRSAQPQPDPDEKPETPDSPTPKPEKGKPEKKKKPSSATKKSKKPTESGRSGKKKSPKINVDQDGKSEGPEEQARPEAGERKGIKGFADKLKQQFREGAEEERAKQEKKGKVIGEGGFRGGVKEGLAKKKRSLSAKKGAKTKKKKAEWKKKAAAQLASSRAKAKEKKAKEQSKLEQKRKEYDAPEAKAKRMDKVIKKLDKLASKAAKEQRRAKGEDLPGRIDRWLKKHPNIENLIRGSADDPENVLWLRLSEELISLSKQDANDFLDRLDKGGEVFFKGYVQSFAAELQAEQDAFEIAELVNNLSIVKNKVK